jgi:hypothetical protein
LTKVLIVIAFVLFVQVVLYYSLGNTARECYALLRRNAAVDSEAGE